MTPPEHRCPTCSRPAARRHHQRAQPFARHVILKAADTAQQAPPSRTRSPSRSSPFIPVPALQDRDRRNRLPGTQAPALDPGANIRRDPRVPRGIANPADVTTHRHH